MSTGCQAREMPLQAKLHFSFYFQNGFLPAFHAFGSVVGMHVLHKGATAINLDGFNPETFLGANQDYKVSIV